MNGFRSCKVTIGNEARIIPESERPVPELTHEWKVYVHAPADVVKKVEFRLHESFSNRLVSVEYPFEMVERGWGEFSIQIKIVLCNGEKIHCSHFLQLHGATDVIVNERVDEIVYRGEPNEVFVEEDEEAEYKKIEDAILKILDKFKEIGA
ncbi:putative transcription initiation factor IIF auxiliary protein [Ordospora colligata]|nr:putative transcription initiation factor IIF auxiliary protein [Ordospora colligata]